MTEVIKLIVDVSVKKDDESLMEVDGWIVKGYRMNETNCLYICENFLSLSKGLTVLGDYHIPLNSCVLGEVPEDIEDEESYIKKIITKLEMSILSYLNSESFNKHLKYSEDLYITDGI